MKKLDFNYFQGSTKDIPDKEDLFKSGIPEASKLRSMIYTLQRLFKTQVKDIKLSLIDDYCFRVDVGNKTTLFYIPGEQRLDLYDFGNLQTPLLVWFRKQVVINNLGPTLESLNVSSLFLPIISYL
jgi:hypothetical protein